MNSMYPRKIIILLYPRNIIYVYETWAPRRKFVLRAAGRWNPVPLLLPWHLNTNQLSSNSISFLSAPCHPWNSTAEQLVCLFLGRTQFVKPVKNNGPLMGGMMRANSWRKSSKKGEWCGRYCLKTLNITNGQLYMGERSPK
ncbi:hypothetical protein VP01_2892g5 [Puccinia sorghi]|uniref:Tet-like 2OG-Fe(II) oxygenase domain-containing protein n=1 Tax=Puccinia sorghi TaxID=27349 RepID=A0A0L6V2B0_9BASI|nr:hypothetical protein VP01_2892g5 [Puccinia sorghi]